MSVHRDKGGGDFNSDALPLFRHNRFLVRQNNRQTEWQTGTDIWYRRLKLDMYLKFWEIFFRSLYPMVAAPARRGRFCTSRTFGTDTRRGFGSRESNPGPSEGRGFNYLAAHCIWLKVKLYNSLCLDNSYELFSQRPQYPRVLTWLTINSKPISNKDCNRFQFTSNSNVGELEILADFEFKRKKDSCFSSSLNED